MAPPHTKVKMHLFWVFTEGVYSPALDILFRDVSINDVGRNLCRGRLQIDRILASDRPVLIFALDSP
jgi:hypothetical protein